MQHAPTVGVVSFLVAKKGSALSSAYEIVNQLNPSPPLRGCKLATVKPPVANQFKILQCTLYCKGRNVPMLAHLSGLTRKLPKTLKAKTHNPLVTTNRNKKAQVYALRV